MHPNHITASALTGPAGYPRALELTAGMAPPYTGTSPSPKQAVIYGTALTGTSGGSAKVSLYAVDSHAALSGDPIA